MQKVEDNVTKPINPKRCSIHWLGGLPTTRALLSIGVIETLGLSHKLARVAGSDSNQWVEKLLDLLIHWGLMSVVDLAMPMHGPCRRMSGVQRNNPHCLNL